MSTLIPLAAFQAFRKLKGANTKAFDLTYFLLLLPDSVDVVIHDVSFKKNLFVGKIYKGIF